MIRSTLLLAALFLGSLFLATGCACELGTRTGALNDRIDAAWDVLNADAERARAAGDTAGAERTAKLSRSLREAQTVGREARKRASRTYYEQAEASVDEIERALGTD